MRSLVDTALPCCGHGGREGFWEPALIFLGGCDPVARDAGCRAQLIEEAWRFILASEERKQALAGSVRYLADLLGLLEERRADWPMLAQVL